MSPSPLRAPPVEQPSKFELVINMVTARWQGVDGDPTFYWQRGI